MKPQKFTAMAAAIVASMNVAQAQIIAIWNFELPGTGTTPYNTLTPLAGRGSASVLGMNKSTCAITVQASYHHEMVGQGRYDYITTNLTGINAVDNDPNFAIRVVNAAVSANNLQVPGGAYNNNFGNWRFDNVALSRVPEPSSLALIGIGLASLLFYRRNRKV